MKKYLSLLLFILLINACSTTRQIPFGIIEVEPSKVHKSGKGYLISTLIHFSKSVDAYTTFYYAQQNNTWVDTGYISYKQIPSSKRKAAQHSVGVYERIAIDQPACLKIIIRAERGIDYKDTVSVNHYVCAEK